MTWVRLDDAMPEHQKIMSLSDGAFRVHVSAICYAARNLTDGVISSGVVRQYGWQRKVRELTEARVWDPVEGGFVIHDYLEYNPSREQVEAERARSHEGKVAGGKARAATAARRGGRFVSQKSDTSSAPAELPAAHQQRTSPVPDPLDPLSVPPTPHRTGLTEEQELIRIKLHGMARDQLLGGASAPDLYWCEDLIRRGLTDTDAEYAVQQSLGKGLKYARTVAERRVIEREAGVDHDQLARDRAATALRESNGGNARSRGVARNGDGAGSLDEFGDLPPGAIRADHGGAAADDSGTRAPISLADRARTGGITR